MCSFQAHKSTYSSTRILGPAAEASAFRSAGPPCGGTCVLDPDQIRFYQIPAPPPLPPALQDTGGRLAYLASCCRSFFNENCQSNFNPILVRFCLQLGLQNPVKIHPKSIPRASSNFDKIVVRFFQFFLRFPSLGDPQNIAKTW